MPGQLLAAVPSIWVTAEMRYQDAVCPIPIDLDQRVGNDVLCPGDHFRESGKELSNRFSTLSVFRLRPRSKYHLP